MSQTPIESLKIYVSHLLRNHLSLSCTAFLAPPSRIIFGGLNTASSKPPNCLYHHPHLDHQIHLHNLHQSLHPHIHSHHHVHPHSFPHHQHLHTLTHPHSHPHLHSHPRVSWSAASPIHISPSPVRSWPLLFLLIHLQVLLPVRLVLQTPFQIWNVLISRTARKALPLNIEPHHSLNFFGNWTNKSQRNVKISYSGINRGLNKNFIYIDKSSRSINLNQLLSWMWVPPLICSFWTCRAYLNWKSNPIYVLSDLSFFSIFVTWC